MYPHWGESGYVLRANVAGQAPVAGFIPVFRRIQRAGKGLLLFCDMTQVETLLSKLSPRGLFLNVSDAPTPQEADELVRKVSRQIKAGLHRSSGSRYWTADPWHNNFSFR